MKKLIFIFICAIFAINANAQFKFKSLDNNNNKTTIVIANDNFKSGSEICCAKFNNDFKTYDATSLTSTQEGGKMVITLTFKKMTVFNNMSVTITINGEPTTVPINMLEVANQLSGYKLILP